MSRCSLYNNLITLIKTNKIINLFVPKYLKNNNLINT